ncbi:MAG: HEAT repeat domain-containing protein, partial [Gemmatimonadetes bacterium]|nr:HEAT repeat domain-containing protein [Gemmatimonadota bacterium]
MARGQSAGSHLHLAHRRRGAASEGAPGARRRRVRREGGGIVGEVRLGPVRVRPTRARSALLAGAGIVWGVGACDTPVPAPVADRYAGYAEIVAEEDARGEIGLGRIDVYLAGDSPALRALAVRALGRLEDPGQVERIVPLLDDAEGEVREAASHAIAQAVFGADPGVVARVQAERIGTEGDPAVLGAIATSLGRLAFGTADARAEADAALVAAAEHLPSVEEDPGLAGRVGLARGIEAFARNGQG